MIQYLVHDPLFSCIAWKMFCQGVAKSFPSLCVNIFTLDKKVQRIFVILYKGKLNTKIT